LRLEASLAPVLVLAGGLAAMGIIGQVESAPSS
jgi:hypothetical protein